MRAVEDWLKPEGEEKAKALFWATMAGKHTAFGGEIYGFRERLDLWLRERGRSRRGGAWTGGPRSISVAEVMEDVDADFLAEVASEGVSLGVDETPRTPVVYEEKVKWTVDPTKGVS